jgi:hypothetical protein
VGLGHAADRRRSVAGTHASAYRRVR